VKAREIRKRSTSDLREELRRFDQEAFEHRFRSHSEEKPDRGFVRRTRRDRARILTVLRERGDARLAPPGERAPEAEAPRGEKSGARAPRRKKEEAS
jgi:ribosomal protein L29